MSNIIDDTHKLMLMMRNIGDSEMCDTCGGYGVRTYGSCSTWHGGISGQRITEDVCDFCWGSGNKNKPWPSHRTFEENAEKAWMYDGLNK